MPKGKRNQVDVAKEAPETGNAAAEENAAADAATSAEQQQEMESLLAQLASDPSKAAEIEAMLAKPETTEAMTQALTAALMTAMMGGGGSGEALLALAGMGPEQTADMQPTAAEPKKGEDKKDDEDDDDDPTQRPTFATTFDQLSFDGGGTRGAMEAFMLKDVMNFVTLMVRHPDKLEKKKWWKDYSFSAQEARDELRKDLDKIDKAKEPPVHPTEVFDMIVGTSTGALIAFGLIGGNKYVL